MPVTLTTIATADPSLRSGQRELLAELRRARRLSRREKLLYERFLSHPSIASRAFAATGLSELLTAGPGERQERFASAAPELSSRALAGALAQTETEGKSIRCLVTATCTGHLCPGLSSYLMETAGLRGDAFTLDLGGMGCGAAIPALRAAHTFLGLNEGGMAAVVCTEICSAAASWDDVPGQILSNSIFADGSAACLLSGGKTCGGLEIIGFATETRPELRDSLRLKSENGSIKNILSPAVPEIAAAMVRKLCCGLLARHGLRAGDVGAWALHPGGMRVLERLQEALGIEKTALAPSLDILKRCGNLSSPSMLYVLKTINDSRPPRGTHILGVTFGAGFSVHGCLFAAR